MRAVLSVSMVLVSASCAVGLSHALLGSYAQAEAPTLPVAQEPFDLARAISEGPALTAAQAAERAAASAPSIERADALRAQAEASVERTRMELLPRLDLTARYAHIDGFPDGRVGGMDPASLAMARNIAEQIEDPAARGLLQANLEQQARGAKIRIPRNQGGFGARLTWYVSDLFFAGLPALEAAAGNVRASQAQALARGLRVRLSARESFYQLARARGNLAVAQRAVAQAEAHKTRVDAGVQAGMRPIADASSAAARLASAEQAVALAETAVDVADASLRTMLQDADGPIYGIAESILTEAAEPMPASTQELLARARAKRPELTALRDTLAARHEALRAQNASGYPHLAVYAGADYASPNRYVIPPSSQFKPSWEVGATLAYAPNDTVLAQRRKGESMAQIRALEADLSELTRALEFEVRTARASVSRSSRSVEAARAALAAAEAAYAQRMAELNAGVITLADLFSAENELNGARLRLLDAAIDQQVQKTRLAYAVGEEPSAPQ